MSHWLAMSCATAIVLAAIGQLSEPGGPEFFVMTSTRNVTARIKGTDNGVRRKEWQPPKGFKFAAFKRLSIELNGKGVQPYDIEITDDATGHKTLMEGVPLCSMTGRCRDLGIMHETIWAKEKTPSGDEYDAEYNAAVKETLVEIYLGPLPGPRPAPPFM